MTLTIGRIKREGRISFGDASLSVWEEGIADARQSGGWDGAQAWERQFKRDVFARIVQQLNRLGWRVGPQHYIRTHNNSRFCQKGFLYADLNISGRTIELSFFQNVNAPTRPDHLGRYERNKEGEMPYVMRLEMERTRRRIRDYLCAVIDGYTFDDKHRSVYRKPLERTAMECIEEHYAESWHFKGDMAEYLKKNGYDQLPRYNRISADGKDLQHGQRVYFFDWHGRICTGTALYNINNMWWVVTGKYDYTNKGCHDLYTALPENFRIKRNTKQRRKRLEGLLADAIKAMNFERAAVLRDILFPKGEQLYAVYHDEHQCYHRSNFQGYAKDIVDAGKFTAAEVKGWNQSPNRVIPLQAA